MLFSFVSLFAVTYLPENSVFRIRIHGFKLFCGDFHILIFFGNLTYCKYCLWKTHKSIETHKPLIGLSLIDFFWQLHIFYILNPGSVF